MSEDLVVDASAGMALLRQEATAPWISGVIRSQRRDGQRLIVPSIFWLEILNVLTRRYRFGATEATQGIVTLEDTGLQTVEISRSLLLLTIDAVQKHRLAAYDAAYLALANALDARLLTTDMTLARAAGDRAIQIGGRHRPSETPVSYGSPRPTPTPGSRGPTLAGSAWPGAAAYLRLLRPRTVDRRPGLPAGRVRSAPRPGGGSPPLVG